MKTNLKCKFLDNFFWLFAFTLILAYVCSIYYDRISLDYIAEGDIGRDLYNFYLVSKGYLPYIDFNWIYGPLAPLIYGLIFKLFGVSFLNAMSLWYIFFIIVAYLQYFVVKSFSNHFFGFLAGTLFISYHGINFLTFNHILGLTVILLCIYLFKCLLESDKKIFLCLLSLSCFFLTITKLNMGLALSGPIFFFLLLYKYINKKPIKPVIYSILMFFILTATVYIGFWSLAPLDQLSKSFPYSSNYLQGPIADPLNSILGADNSTVTFDCYKQMHFTIIFFILSMNFWFFLIILAAMIFSFFIYKHEKFSANFIFLITLAFMGLASTHEFMKIGTFYSLRFWTIPILVPLLFFMVCILIEKYSAKKYFKPIFISFCLIFFFVFSFKLYFTLLFSNIKSVYCPYERVKVNFTNIPWYLTMFKVVEYIEKNTQPDEKILSLPYNMLPVFITKRETATTRYNEFLYLSQLTEKDERNVIESIEKEKVKIILYAQSEAKIYGGRGTFGKTHCKILDKYIKDNYFLDRQYHFKGNSTYYLVPIAFYKRKNPFKHNNLESKKKEKSSKL